MSTLVEFLYPSPARRSVTGIVSWWERRRIAYNALVGGAGLVTLSVVTTLQMIPPFSSPSFPPWQVIVAYGIGANLMYSLGWVVEIAAEKLFRGELLPIGPALYRMGLTFAIGLTLLPAVVISFVWVVAVVVTLFGLG
ncbi:MAG TPA: hypothetical protein VJ925_07490 [Longimicrobiales bacterium]|nr:hypothetical protein [Longimicrobiales bacterium]